MREERFPWGLGAVLVLLIVGGIGFWLGSSSVSPVIVPVSAPVVQAPAPAPVTPVTPVYPTYAPHGGGFPVFPVLIGLFVIFVIAKGARRAAWASSRGSWGNTPGGHSRHGWGWPDDARGHHGSGWHNPAADGQSTPPPTDPTSEFQRWHDQMHNASPPPPDSPTLPAAEPPSGSTGTPPSNASA